MLVPFRYSEIVPAFTFTANNEHNNHIRFAIKKFFLYSTRFKGEYNWIKDERQFETTCPTGRVSPREISSLDVILLVLSCSGSFETVKEQRIKPATSGLQVV